MSLHPQRIILNVAIIAGLGTASPFGAGPELALVQCGSQSTTAAPPGKTQKTIFASRCFWCTEADFDKINGVLSTTSGYIGGRVPSPTYEQVSRGGTGHAEAVEVIFDSGVVTYEHLLD